MTSHKDLIVWQKSVALATEVYAATRSLPSEERFDFNRQLRQAAISIASNIAEGSSRKSPAEFVQFLYTSRGSLSLIETQIMIASDLGLIEKHEMLLKDIAEIGHLLNGLIRSIKSAARTAHAKACASSPSSFSR